MKKNNVTKADINYFIRRIKDVSYYNRKIITINNTLSGIAYEMQGVKSISITPYIIENKKPYNQQRLLELIEEEQSYINERNIYEKYILDMEKLFMNLDIDVRNYVTELYLIGYNHTAIANKHGYSRQNLYKIINNSIKKLLKNERVTL